MNWALEFAPLSKSFLYGWQAHERPRLYTFTVAEPVKVTKKELREGILPVKIPAPEEVMLEGQPLFDRFSPGDRLYTVLGGKSGPFCLQAMERGVEIFRIPDFRLAELFAKRGQTSEYDDDLDAGLADDFPAEVDVRQAEKSRKERAWLMVELVQQSPELFYHTLSADPTVMRIQAYIRAYVNLQRRMRIPAQLRMYAMRFNLGWLPDREEAKRLEETRTLLGTADDVGYYVRLEERFLASVSPELRKLAIWREFLEPIPGIGPSLAARLIGVISDIRRFPRRAGFRAYAAWSVTADGRAPRYQRRSPHDEKREPTSNHNLKVALFLVGEQIVRQGEDNPYNPLYYRHREKYSERHGHTLKDRCLWCHRRGVRSAVSSFVNGFWAAWWRIVEAEGEPLPQSVRDTLYPTPPKR